MFFKIGRPALLWVLLFALPLTGVLGGCKIERINQPNNTAVTTPAVIVTAPAVRPETSALQTTPATTSPPLPSMEITYDHYLLGDYAIELLGEELYAFYSDLVAAVLRYENRIPIPEGLRRNPKLRFVSNFFQRHNLLGFLTGTPFYSVDGRYIEFDYRVGRDEFDIRVKAIEETVPAMVRSIFKEGYNQTDAALAAYTYLARNTRYTFDTESTDAYGVIMNGEGVCVGFTYAFQLLMRSAGFNDGVACEWTPAEPGAEGHIWNVMPLNGDYYHIDATWENGDGATGGFGLRYFGMDDALRSAVGTPYWAMDLQDESYAPPVCASDGLAVLYESLCAFPDLDAHKMYFMTDAGWFVLDTADLSITAVEAADVPAEG